ncbi:hypothetical protein NE237_017714 [Protea cynaroides]|uniref:Protein FAR1-RELATED SEQUENCE n=1 Tax=Protea cynaroides TaxID=273540 RepID=A0A9Q0QNA5_9MAGN|nr:hypothetical protein NE237_017714 [Protea cynaroides]
MEFKPLSMDNGVMEFDMASGEDDEVAFDVEHPDEDGDYEDDLVDCSIRVGRELAVFSDGDLNLEPYVGMEFESEEAARIFYNSYARRVGFGTRVSVYHRSRRDGAIICRQIVCSRQGFLNGKNLDRDGSGGGKSKSKRRRAETRVGCKAIIMVKKQDFGKWVMVPPDKVHCPRSHRHVPGPAGSLIDTLQAAGIGPSGVMSVLIKESGGIDNVAFIPVDCRNYMSRSSRQRTLGSGGQHVLDYLKRMHAENPAFFNSIQGNGEHSTGNIFWKHLLGRCQFQMNYSYFGDTVTFDTTYRTNRYRVPFAPFTGLNHHGQPVLFGCGLLLNESESSRPVSITTDQDRIIRSAVAQVFPETRHRFCKWNVFREAQEKLFFVYESQPTFEADFCKCINTTETIDEFDLLENEWLQTMYNVCHQWVPVFLLDTFFGDFTTTQGSYRINSFFDGFVNASTAIQVLIKQFEKAIASRHEKEVKADYDTINTAPILKTPSPTEKQVANLYTRGIFMKFQEKLDMGQSPLRGLQNLGKTAHIVRFDIFEKKATCTCQMFEFSGIICRHILAVFKISNVLMLPSHYVLKRWTRNAKSGIVLDESALDSSSSSRESSTGAKSVHFYNVAMDALQEAAKKVAAAKKHSSGVRLVNGNNNQGMLAVQGNQVGLLQPYSADEKDKKIQELNTELDNANHCEVYRANLLAVLKDMEEQKLRLTVKVQNVRLCLKD